MTSYNLKILTPEGVIYDDKANSFQTTTETGRIGIYANMTNLMGLLKPNISIIEDANAKKNEYVVIGGIINVTKNDVKVFCDMCIDKKTLKVDEIKKEINNLEQLIAKTTKDTLKKSYETKLNINKEILKLINA